MSKVIQMPLLDEDCNSPINLNQAFQTENLNVMDPTINTFGYGRYVFYSVFSTISLCFWRPKADEKYADIIVDICPLLSRWA